MTDRFKDFLARNVFHPLQGMALGQWWALLRRHRFAVDLPHLHRAIIQTAFSASNSAAAWAERARFDKRIAAVQLEAPLFILGHYRSGTTHLHNLLALDPQFAAPTFYQVLNPHTFLSNERWITPIVDTIMVKRRYQDEMALNASAPSEDEFAMCTMTGLSPYLGWCFPEDERMYAQYFTFREATSAELDRWKRALIYFFKKLTLVHGRPLVLKSPPHTARVRLLLDLFPEARFIHIHRHPYEVFLSTRHLARVVPPLYQLRNAPVPDGADRIIAIYNEMYDAYFEERGQVPAGRICEVAYDKLEREPMAVIESVYNDLGLAGFEQLQPRLAEYLGTISGYRKNKHDDLPAELRRRIARDWGRSFDEWGYTE